ncbi:unnamed protein product [Sphenostylis stenocarpa]|uniref:Uncharacterized protein n=1 Tax=Sphenostylis stenocarpa TaxID=92480 RepID=A0AA86VVM7_9FABA|nr:unnamed protein product [Sphenostylis stenocarpa]
MSSSFSPSRPPQQLIGVSRLRSSSLKKLPEPLRRAVADCLSSTISPSNEPSRTLQVNLWEGALLLYILFLTRYATYLALKLPITIFIGTTATGCVKSWKLVNLLSSLLFKGWAMKKDGGYGFLN